MKDFMKLDLYDILNIKSNASESEIKKAYRKKALTCHPDKNPGNPKAIDEFKQLSKVIEILTHPVKRAEYDKILRERKAENAKRIFDRSSNDSPNRKQPKMAVPKWPPSFSSKAKHEPVFKQNIRRDNCFKKRTVPTWPPSASKVPFKRDFSRPTATHFKSFDSSIIKPATFIPPPKPNEFPNNQFGSFSNSPFQNGFGWKKSSILKPATFIPPSNS